MTRLRNILLASALFAAMATPAVGQSLARLEKPTLRATVSLTSDLVRIGDLVENAGPAADIAIYRAPDLGTVGTLLVSDVIKTLGEHHVIGVDIGKLREISITRPARHIEASEVESQIAQALANRNGLGRAADIRMTFDREVQALTTDAEATGALSPLSSRFDLRNGRFDVTLAIPAANGSQTRIRYTGVAVETVEATVVTRSVERNEVLKASDVTVERRPRAEVGLDNITREQALGMQIRRPVRAGQPIRSADLTKPDLVQRDQPVTLVFESSGIYLTIRGKATENGTEGDVVNVMNLQSKRMISGIVSGRGQVTVSSPIARRLPPAPAQDQAPATVSQVKTPITVAAAVPATASVARTAE